MKLRNILLITFLTLAISPGLAEAAQNFTATGTYTTPANTSYVWVEVWGAGGGGGGTSNNWNAGGGGGGGGAFSAGYVAVTPGQNYTVTVGTGGTGGSQAAGGVGGDSWFSTNTTVMAKGGSGGRRDSDPANPASGLGGNATLGYGITKYSGGNGALGGGPGSGTGVRQNAGGGGAGNASAGGNASDTTAGTGGTTGGGAGGAGRTTDGNGNTPSTIGGGGGGAFCDSSCTGSSWSGAQGARGEVRVYEVNLTANILQVNVYAESTAQIITGTTITITTSNESYTNTTTTTSGVAYIENLPDGQYSISLSGGTYTQRTYTITAANNTLQTLNAYLSNGSQVIMTFVDINTGQPLEGAITSMARVINGAWTTVEARSSGPDGRSAFTYESSTQYRFITTLADYDANSFILNPILFNAYTVRLTPEATAENDAGDYAGVGIAYGPRVFYNQAQNNLTFQITSPEGLLTAYTLNITYPGGTNATSGVNSYGETFLLTFTPNAASILETVNITYSYTTTIGGLHNFSTSYPIQGSFGNYTFINSISEDYGMGDFEKVILATMFVMFVWGMVTMYAGSTAGAGVGMLMMGYFAWIGFIPFMLFLISALAGFSLLTWRSTQ